MSEWISVDDALPADDEMVCLGGNYKWYCVMYWGYEDRDFSDEKDYYVTGWSTPDITRTQLALLATHWMPLPSPPKEQ